MDILDGSGLWAITDGGGTPPVTLQKTILTITDITRIDAILSKHREESFDYESIQKKHREERVSL